jgi:hypothetical protein
MSTKSVLFTYRLSVGLGTEKKGEKILTRDEFSSGFPADFLSPILG